MTKRVTVSLPDDIAAYLERSDNASATVAHALRAFMNRGESTEAILKAMGFKITEEGKTYWRDKIRPMGTEQRARLAKRRQQLLDGTWREEQAG